MLIDSGKCLQIFHEMEAASKHDPQCAPNVISYSAVMTACCMGGHPAKAEDWFKHMRARNIKPDHICYSTLIAGGPARSSMPRPPGALVVQIVSTCPRHKPGNIDVC